MGVCANCHQLEHGAPPHIQSLAYHTCRSMPGLHSLCFSPPSFSNSSITSQLPSLPGAKPSSLGGAASSFKTHSHSDIQISLPDLPSHVKEKILSLEIMGIDSGRALSLNPALLDASPDSIHSVISYLCSKGIHHKDLARIFGMCPKLLTSSIRSDLSPVFAFLSQDLNVPDARFRRVINKCPRLLASSVRDQLRPAFLYLQRLGFRDTNALAFQDPVLLVSSIENTLIPKLEFLIGLGLSREDAVGMVLRCPGLFTFSVENNFKPKYEYLVEEMGGTLEELKEFPQYFAFSLEKRIKPRHQEIMMMGRGTKLPLSVMLKSTDDEFKELLSIEIN